jgi:hypothetical protein
MLNGRRVGMEQLLSSVRILWQANASAAESARRSRTAQLLAVLLVVCGFGWYVTVRHDLPQMSLSDIPQFTLSSIVALICVIRLLWLKHYLEQMQAHWQALRPALPFDAFPLAQRIAITLASFVLRVRLLAHTLMLQRGFPDQAINTLIDTLRLSIARWQLHVNTPDIGYVLTRELRSMLQDALAWVYRLETLLQDRLLGAASLLPLTILQSLLSPYKALLCPRTQRPTVMVLRC